MSRFDYDMIVIGGGAAGLTVTAGAAQLGARTLLVEREEALGGDCLHYGCVPSKTLIRTARLYHQIKNSSYYGLPSVEVPEVDFSQVRKRIRDVIATIEEHDSPKRFCSLGAKVVFGGAEFLNEHEISVDGRRYSGKKICIATGSSPAIPHINGLNDVSYHTNKTIFFMDRLPERLIILGGGAIAIEMAQAFSRLGSLVTVCQRSDRILTKEDPDCAHLIQGILEGEGVKFLLGTKVRSVVKAPDGGIGVNVHRASTGKEVMVEGDTLLVALGRSANLDGLSLENAGVEFDRRGIDVDARLRTSRKHIFAAGDVIGKYQFTHAAGYEGGIVVANAIFRLPRKVDYTFMPRCIYTDPELATVGLTEAECLEMGIDFEVIKEPFSANDRAITEGATTGFIKLIIGDNGRPVGVQILGPHAGDLLSHWMVALNGRVKPSTVAQAIHPYPTFGEINKKVMGNLVSRWLFSDTMKRGLKFFFNLKGRACSIEEQ